MNAVAVVQMRAEPRAKERNLIRSGEWIRRAAEQGAELVVLPELCCTEYIGLLQDPQRLREAAEPIPDGPSTTYWAALCQELKVHVVAGLVEHTSDGIFNSAAVVGPSGVVGVYRKVHLFGPEQALFLPGDTGFPVFDLPCGRVGVLICYDLRFVEAARIVGLQGAEILAVPTTWTDLNKPDPWDERGWCMANHLALVHAYTNRYFVACANRAGAQDGVRYLGCSQLIDPKGNVLQGPAPPDLEGVWVAHIDRSAARDKGLGINNLWADRRTDMYGEFLGYRKPGSTDHL